MREGEGAAKIMLCAGRIGAPFKGRRRCEAPSVDRRVGRDAVGRARELAWRVIGWQFEGEPGRVPGR